MYDYIIVGGGAAGCVIATRLAQRSDAKILLLEAGPRDTDPYIHMPVGFFKMTTGPLTWGYKSAPQRHCQGREILLPQGRVIGGGSSINAQVFTRGVPQDYDRWANDEGCAGWAFEDIRKYFVRSEDNDTFCNEWHGVGGPQGASSLNPHQMTRVFVQACQQFGMPYNPDFNGAQQEGCGVYQTTTRNARRCSTAVGYLRLVADRPNLTTEVNAMTTRVVVENGRAIGVDYTVNGQPRTARAAQEVIVAAGAIGSPKLLMLSGIGPAAHLREFGIDVVADSPGVGQNLHDHYDLDIVYELASANSYDKYNKITWKVWAGLQYKMFNGGPVASNLAEGGAFWYADKDAETPDTQFHLMVGAGVEAGVPPVPSGSGLTLNTYFLRPRSRGSVTLKSADHRDAPIIDPNYIDDPYDLEMSIRGVKMMREIMTQPVFTKHLKGEHWPGDSIKTDAELEEYVRRVGRTSYHHVGTCKMGVDDMAVVDPQLRVNGIEQLRVCDSSVMPSIVSSNTNAPSIMIGEKASDLILAAA